MAGETGQTTSRLLNRLAYDFANKASDIGTAATGDFVLIADISDDYEVKYGDGANLLEMIGSTVTAAELDYLDITTLGTGAASKAVVLNSSGDYTYPATATIVYPSSATLTLQSGSTIDIAGTFNIGAVAMTSTAAELNYLDITTLGTGAASKAVVLDASGDYTYPASATIVHPSGATESHSSGSTLNVAGTFQIGGVTVTATAAEINARSAAASRLVNVTDATTYTVLAADSGKIHIMPNFTSSCTLALPAVAAGLEYTFVGKAVAADAQNWIIQSASATNFFLGGVSFADTDAGAGADEIHAGVWSNGSTNDFLTVVTPGAGTYIYMICDGTNWIVNGQVSSATAPAFSDT